MKGDKSTVKQRNIMPCNRGIVKQMVHDRNRTRDAENMSMLQVVPC